jgi:hypothetical protein
MTQRSGKTVWPTIESSVFAMKAASFLAGVIRTYFNGEKVKRVTALQGLQRGQITEECSAKTLQH